MAGSLWAGISGLNASSRQMDVIGNNIANVNTVGFKAGSTVFGDILSQSITGGSGAMQIGRGVGVTAVPTLFGQGSFASTQSATDLAIDGEGFFMVNDSDGATYYTRAGMFNMGEGGYLRDVNGYKVQGYLYQGGVNTNAIGDISLSGIQSDPSATIEFSIGANLDSEAAVDDIFISAQTVYDSLGGAHTLKIEFTKTANAREWTYEAFLDGDETAAACATNTITFEDDGSLDAATFGDIDFDFTAFQSDPDLNPSEATFGDGTNIIKWVVEGDPATASLTPEVMTGYASSSVNRSLVSNGWASGELQSLSIGDDGVIDGFFTNGQSIAIGQIALARFANTLGLKKMGSCLFAATVSSGDALVNKPGTGGLGGISPNSLEMSNADIATEFINMITAQKAYQASAKVVSTTDQMLSELMNIKR